MYVVGKQREVPDTLSRRSDHYPSKQELVALVVVYDLIPRVMFIFGDLPTIRLFVVVWWRSRLKVPLSRSEGTNERQRLIHIMPI